MERGERREGNARDLMGRKKRGVEGNVYFRVFDRDLRYLGSLN